MALISSKNHLLEYIFPRSSQRVSTRICASRPSNDKSIWPKGITCNYSKEEDHWVGHVVYYVAFISLLQRLPCIRLYRSTNLNATYAGIRVNFCPEMISPFNTDTDIRLLLTNCVIAGLTGTLYLEGTTGNTFVQNTILFTLFFFVVLNIVDIPLQTYTGHRCNMSSTIATILGINLAVFIVSLAVKNKYISSCVQTIDGIASAVCFLTAWLFSRILDLTAGKKGDACNIDRMQGLDYGTCMAHSYYHGYLKIMLPSTGSLNKGLVEKIENTEDSHNIKIAVHKLFVLIPSSSYIPPDLRDASYKWMESAMDLEDEVRNRAGVKRRVYHNTVYKIYPNGQRANTPVYVVVEGATPLLTFCEAQKHSHRETEVFQKHCKDIIRKFYEKIQELIDADPECAGLCEFIYYDDRDKNNEKVNIAKIILDRLSEIQKTRSANDTSSS